jgi:hypothetical protein
MIYGNGYALADDIVGHELTHGVTQYESNLFYYYQSGAINESFSDVWGELYDQQNGLGNDSADVKWLMGEEAPGGALRSMSNPPASPYLDPDKMTSTNYYTGTSDDGGVHTNSGINNKAAYLMVDGGSFNGKTVTAIGADKTLAIYYEVQTNLLTSGADYADLYNALYQGCLNLVGGAAGIVSGDCQQVRNATDAVEMSLQPMPNFNTEAAMCTAGLAPNDTLYDNLESGTSNWTIANGRWQYGSPYGTYAHSGTNFLFADDVPATMDDAYVKLKPVTIPANGYLHFSHAYDFENYSSEPKYYDGGVLEYSINGGVNWVDAGSLIQVNGYSGTISTTENNPLKGRSAFVGTSHGYISTRLNLASLAGQSVTFRWRMGLDDGGSRWGWWLDDVRVYECIKARPYVVSSIRTSANPTSASSVNFTVTFSDPMTGVNTTAPFSDFELTTSSGISGASITGVSGTGATYTVTVNTGSGGGTIRLDVPLTATITDLAGKSLTGLPFITGESYTVRSIDVYIGGSLKGSYFLNQGQSTRQNYASLDSGPVIVESTNGVPIISSIREAWENNGVTTSFAQLMGLPAGQLSNKYVYPGYNNVTLDEQLRIGNVDTVPSTVVVTIGGTPKGTYTLYPPGSLLGPSAMRINYPGVDSGPVVVEGTPNVNIISSIREAWVNNGVTTSFAQLMGLPAGQLSNKYVYPGYNNVTLDEQLRIGNVDTVPSTVVVTIGGVPKGTYTLYPPGSLLGSSAMRINYPGVDSGPVVVEGTPNVKLISSIREAWENNGVTTSFVQLMGLPVGQISNKYVYPGYNNVTLDEQLRIGVP